MVDLKMIGQVYIHHTRGLLQEMANGPVTVDFFETFINDICHYYSSYVGDGTDGLGYYDAVNEVGLLLDQKFNNDSQSVIGWLETELDDFGGASPIELICVGAADRVADYIKQNLTK